jgi:prepilin-type N-terminal cleavage/methylation domain-containing protein
MMTRNERGFTLIELVMVVVIISIVAFIVGDSLIIGMRAYFAAEDRTEAIEKGRVTLERIEREVRNAVLIDNATADSATLCFNDIYARTVSFRYSGTQVLRQEWTPANTGACPGAGGTVLADGITAFSFTYNGTGVVDATPTASTKRVWVSLTSTSGDESIDLQSQAYPVNLW